MIEIVYFISLVILFIVFRKKRNKLMFCFIPSTIITIIICSVKVFTNEPEVNITSEFIPAEKVVGNEIFIKDRRTGYTIVDSLVTQDTISGITKEDTETKIPGIVIIGLTKTDTKIIKYHICSGK